MTALPSGTVTLLFSDIESSTQMVHALGDVWPEVLDAQRAICRRAWAAHDGHEIGTEGDSFFVAFATAPEAVAAAVEVQRALGAAVWSDGVEVRVRIGVHTGSPQRHGDGYVGLDVHRAARVAAAAHGGQVLASEATARLLDASLAADGHWLDLGEHQLKDIPVRTRLFQVVAAGLMASFPPVRTLGAAGGLPARLGEVVGRESEVGELQALVRAGHRLVTLTGPGGTGKTTLSLAVAAEVGDDFPDGVFAVRLAGVTTAPGMWAALSQVLDVPADGQAPPGFFTYVAHRRVLLVLDNLEQIDDADVVVRALLESAAHVAVLATSRRPLHVDGEREYAVSPLREDAAQELFVQHATRVRRSFALTPDNTAAVAAICAALDGLPLAIEIAAARCKLLSPQAILARIDQSLDLASTDRSRDARQATVRGAIAWSHDLLDPPHRSVLANLGVFVGGASYEAVEAVVPPEDLAGLDLADLLFDLVDASLVTAVDTENGEPRFGLLETVRRFALDQLEQKGHTHAALSRHAQWIYDLCRALRERIEDEQSAVRVDFIREIGNIDAVVDRGAPSIRHTEMYGRRVVPAAHVIVLVGGLALTVSRFNESLSWVQVGLERWLTPRDGAGALALMSLRANISSFIGITDETVNFGQEAWSRYEANDHLASVAPWVQPTRSAVAAAAAAGWALSMRDAEAAGQWRARLASVVSADSSLFVLVALAKLDYAIADARDDVVGAREHLEKLMRLEKSSGRWIAVWENNIADLDLQLGRRRAAQQRLARMAVDFIDQGNIYSILVAAETMAAAIGPEHPLLCARVYGCASATRAVEGIPNDEYGDVEDERVLASVRPLVDADAWEIAWDRGRNENIADLMLAMAELPLIEPTDAEHVGDSLAPSRDAK